MTYALRFLPEVEDDVISGYSWYEDKARGLGEEFTVPATIEDPAILGEIQERH